jgi:Fe-S cluster biogenesis protein NfuA/nitrite reductase/ring-hydroxylating ferredoxin subunit
MAAVAEPARGAPDPERLVARVQELTAQLDSFPDVRARQTSEELVGAVVEMYGAGLERVMEIVGEDARAALCEDGLVAGLLLIHDLFPVPLEERVQEALDSVRPYMESHGGNVELLGIEDGVAYLRLQGSCKSCRASSSTLELAVRQALEQAAPDLEGMEVEGVMEDEPAPAGMELPMAGGAAPMGGVASPTAPSWFEVDVAEPALESLAVAEVDGRSLVVANVEGTLLAFANRCAACDGPLDAGVLVAGALTCPSCSRSFFLPRAGRSMDDDGLQLGPVPLLRDGGAVKVALA